MANRIKEMRKKKGLSQKEFAKAFNEFAPNIKNVSYATISRWENGKNEPKLNTWLKLSDFFNVNIEYLQGFSDYKINKSELNYQMNIQSVLRNLQDIKFLQQNNSNSNDKHTELEQLYASILGNVSSAIRNIIPDNSYNEEETKASKDILNSLNKLSLCIKDLTSYIVLCRNAHSITKQETKKMEMLNSMLLKSIHDFSNSQK